MRRRIVAHQQKSQHLRGLFWLATRCSQRLFHCWTPRPIRHSAKQRQIEGLDPIANLEKREWQRPVEVPLVARGQWRSARSCRVLPEDWCLLVVSAETRFEKRQWERSQEQALQEASR